MFQLPHNLDRWIQYKLHVYSCKKKPRKGTPRGESYPIPERKYHAALLHLAYTRTFNLRAIAKQAGVSYSLLLKWRTEDRFMDLVRQAISEYSEIVLSTIISQTYGLDSYRLFIRKELANYSISLVNGIIGELSQLCQSYQEKLGSPKSTWDDVWPLLRMSTFSHLLWEARINALNTWGNKEEKKSFYESRTQFSSIFLTMSRIAFKHALRNDLKKDAQKILNTLCDFAEAQSLEVANLRKAIVERGLDVPITKDTDK